MRSLLRLFLFEMTVSPETMFISFRATKDWKSKASVWSLLHEWTGSSLGWRVVPLHLTGFTQKWARDASLASELWRPKNEVVLTQKRNKIILHMYCSCEVVCNPLRECTALNCILADNDCYDVRRCYVIRHGKNARRGVTSSELRVSCELRTKLRHARGKLKDKGTDL